MLNSLSDLGALYQDYGYAYPHKNAYRPFEKPRPLEEVWADEDKSRVFLYLHIPFCEMRCGFCNLFTLAHPDDDYVSRYLDALFREMEAAHARIGAVRPVRVAIGGGTPTMLRVDALATLFARMQSAFGIDFERAGAAIETSPKTATREMIALLEAHRIARVSIGIQSFVEAETRVMGRPQRTGEAEAALDIIRAHEFERLNIDLIYGADNQTVESWRESIRRALRWAPEEIYLYPLYVRPRTGLDGRVAVDDGHRSALYSAGRDLLLAEGYAQRSMRAFQRGGAACGADNEYSCQEDGMLGLGAGARSYTRRAHYATPYAVSRAGVLDILQAYTARSSQDFAFAHHGYDIDVDERMRRHLLKSILRCEGLDTARFNSLFGAAPTTAFPELDRLIDLGLYMQDGNFIRPTEAGLEHSDSIPPLFYSNAVRARLDAARVA